MVVLKTKIAPTPERLRRSVVPAKSRGVLGMTLKQRCFLEEYFKTGNGQEAAMKTYNCKSRAIASAIAAQNLKKLKQPIKDYLEANGLSLRALTSILVQGLAASKPVVNKEEIVDYPDFSVRHKYMDSLAKWLGVEEATQPQVVVDQRQITIVKDFLSTTNLKEEKTDEPQNR